MYPENCADMLRATKQLLIIDCSSNGHTLILWRQDMSLVTVNQPSTTSFTENMSMAVVELGDFT